MKKQLYSENWSDTIRPSILKRDNYKCQICKVKHRARGYYDSKNLFVECDDHMVSYAARHNIKLIRIILQVHHRNENKKDNADNNLITLCPRCHMNENRQSSIIKRKLKGIIYPK
jgi:5-methylcytosine-specific restriction endonuclease McrA